MAEKVTEWRVRLTTRDEAIGRHYGWTVLQEDAPGKWRELASGSSYSWAACSGSFERILAAAYGARDRHPSSG